MTILHKQFGDADSSSLADVGILITHAVAQWLDQTGSDLVNVDISHCPDSQRSDQRVGVLHVLFDCKGKVSAPFLCTTLCGMR